MDEYWMEAALSLAHPDSNLRFSHPKPNAFRNPNTTIDYISC